MNDSSNLPATPSENSDGFDLVAETDPNISQRVEYFKFRKGQFLRGQEPVSPALLSKMLFIAVAVSESWTRLEKGEPPIKIRRERDKPFPRRDELGDLDQRLWPLFADKPSDPWTRPLELLLVEKETGRPVIFSIATDSGRPCVEDLCRLITIQRRIRGPQAKPIIIFQAGTRNSRNGPLAVPQIKVVEGPWVDEVGSGSGSAPGPTRLQQDLTDHIEQRSTIDPKANVAGIGAEPAKPARGQRGKAPPPPWEDNDLNDEIPY
jgi:hypothetical protein